MKPTAFVASLQDDSFCALTVLFALLGTAALRADDSSPIPQPRPAVRYEQLRRQSPFALATVVEPTAAPQASFAANWFVSGIGRFGDEEFVTIKARDLSSQFSLYGQDVNPENGVSLASVEWSDKIGKSTIIIRRGTETAKLEFNEAEMNGPAQVTTAPGGPAGANKKETSQTARGAAQTLKPLPPYSPERPATPSPATSAAPFPKSTPPPGGNSSQSQQSQDRRRIRIITAPQP